ncbi:MAG: response regulator receiver protein [Acidimicrobiales bacterium]|nr:response regulator receiver protein [Acidimicrobiales bacterium]
MTTGSAPARQALARHDWSGAYELLTSGDRAADGGATDDLGAEELDLLAEASWWLGRIEECIVAREAAFQAYESAGARRQAAQCAVWLVEHHWFLARPSIAGAWLRRARKTIDDDTECVEYGNLLLREAEAVHSTGELDAAIERATEAAALARRVGSDELEALALNAEGRLLIDRGEAEDGMQRLDEAMLLATQDRVGPYATGKIYCSLISACDALGDLARASEWTDATLRWSDRHPLAVFPGLCRVHRAQVLGLRGAWDEAVQEAHRACTELESVNIGNAAVAWAEIGDIRRRLGDLDGAEDAFRTADELCGRPAAGLALLRLAQGRASAATTIIDDALAGEQWNRLARVRLLPAKVQIEVANGNLDAARPAVEELEDIATTYATVAAQAAAATCRGRLELAQGSCRAACDALRRAVELWQALDVPYETATARLLLGQACREGGDKEGGAFSLLAAAEGFERLGAVLDARRTRTLQEGTAATLPAGLTEREAEVLRLVTSGLTNKDIASQLHLSAKTVGRHLENIFVKLGVSSRAAATAFAVSEGLIDRP